MMHSIRGAAWLVMASLLLSACKGGGSDTSTSATPTPPSSSVPVNRAPSISAPTESTVLVGRELKLTPSASDPDGQALTFTVDNKPSWLSFSAQTGELVGTPGDADVGTYSNIRITVSDGQATASRTISITVAAAVTGRATLSWSAPTERTDGAPLTDLAGFKIYYGNSPGSLGSVIEIRDAGARSWVVENLTQGTWYFAATAFDTSGTESARSNPASKTIT
jgi:hypothetical protein